MTSFKSGGILAANGRPNGDPPHPATPTTKHSARTETAHGHRTMTVGADLIGSLHVPAARLSSPARRRTRMALPQPRVTVNLDDTDPRSVRNLEAERPRASALLGLSDFLCKWS
jgi:hypothetical protein